MTHNTDNSISQVGIPSSSIDGGGFVKQTFLGASITDFNVSAGFGDSTSTISVNLVPDSLNSGDSNGLGIGDDVYHDGKEDKFRPPPVGAPVFFKFGSQLANVDQAFRKTYDDTYPAQVVTASKHGPGGEGGGNPGHFHFAFGGILKAINETKDQAGNPQYSSQISDPREILGNVELILNNYAGTTFNNRNMFNLYGFLEFNLSETLKKKVPVKDITINYDVEGDTLIRTDKADGTSTYSGTDMLLGVPSVIVEGETKLEIDNIEETYSSNAYGRPMFPMTGTGFSRRSAQGIPFYRVIQSMSALFGWYGSIPQVYVDAGFGGYINFRGFNYVVDFAGVPNINQFYFLDYDKITLLDLLLEVCEVSNHELIVSLLPITDHPACSDFKAINDEQIALGQEGMKDIIAGVIRVDTIDRSKPQPNGAIKSYIDDLLDNNVEVTNTSFGSELSNVNTDKFVVGANETDMYYFSANADRREADTRLQWDLDYSFKQQILPYYGTLPGNSSHGETVTIPKGFGSYQQILLDASKLNAVGVGNFYVATELELRAAAVSFKRWCDFLLHYDNVYMESTEANDVEEGAALIAQIPQNFVGQGHHPRISNNYAVSVPRSVWPSDRNFYNDAGLPASPCNPPYGYPLYYARATQIGLPTEGATSVTSAAANLRDRNRIKAEMRRAAGIANKKAKEQEEKRKNVRKGGSPAFAFLESAASVFLNTLTSALSIIPGFGILSTLNSAYNISNFLGGPLSDAAKKVLSAIASTEEPLVVDNTNLKALNDTFALGNRIGKKGVKNAKKVYEFVKGVADECLGKKFLVKMPNKINVFYNSIVTSDNNGNILEGPFGFPAVSIDQLATHKHNLSDRVAAHPAGEPSMRSYLADSSIFKPEDNFTGAMEVNFNPITNKYQFNYEPDTQGGFIEYDLLSNFSASFQPLSVSNGLAPADISIFDKGNSRISPYVRFDHSQNLSFQGFSANSLTQQQIKSGFHVPDLSYTLDNLTAGKLKDLPPANTSKPEQVTFVECTLDDKFYMAPTSSTQSFPVHGQKIIEDFTLSTPKQIYSSSGCDYTPAIQFTQMVAVPAPIEGGPCSFTHFNSVVTFHQHQFQVDTDHVYALITIPGKVEATLDSRLRDGPLQSYATTQIKHNVAADVVRGVCGFDQPALRGTPTDFHGDFLLQPLGSDGMAAVKKATQMANFAMPNKVEFCQPSPIYPDMVALPLMSKTRCYGPWVSSQVGGHSDIGGKIEYIKDENLAPWNYSGYDLMNKAGLVQAEFSNSLLLASERGSFSIPRAPSGVSLAKSLQDDGPLVSNISVRVSPQGVTTDYQLDLYTASFGKLQKQRLDNISKIGRNQQKLEDERNALIRKGFGKNQTNISLQSIYNVLQKQISNATNITYTRAQKSPGYNPNYNIMSVIPTIQDFTDGLNGNFSLVHNQVAGSITSKDELEEAGDAMSDESQLMEQFGNTAMSKTTEDQAPASYLPGNTAMASADIPNLDATRDIMNNVDGFNDAYNLSDDWTDLKGTDNGIV